MHIQAQDLSKIYGQGENQVTALNRASLEIAPGDFISIAGPSGSGKSTLLHLLSGLDRPTSGRLTYDGRDICGLTDRELSAFRRRRIGFIFQQFRLLPVQIRFVRLFPVQQQGHDDVLPCRQDRQQDVAGERQADHVEPVRPEQVQGVDPRPGHRGGHVPAGLPEEARDQGQAEDVGLARAGQQQDAAPVGRDRFALQLGAEAAAHGVEPPEGLCHRQEVAGILLPEGAEMPGRRGEQVEEQARERQAAVAQGVHPGVEVDRAGGQEQGGQRHGLERRTESPTAVPPLSPAQSSHRPSRSDSGAGDTPRRPEGRPCTSTANGGLTVPP